MTRRILLVGGGTGGHVYPLVSIAEELQKKASEHNINLELVVFSDSSIWKNDFQGLGVKFIKILAPKLRRFQGNLNLLDLFKIPFALIQVFWYMFWFMPDLVFLKGGYVSVIPAIAAKFYFIPIFIHESDTVPGKTNSFLSGFAKKIFISFEITRKYFPGKKVILSGNPIRKGLLNGNEISASQKFNLSLDKKTILVLGGSQGAKKINQLIINSLIQLVQKYQVILQSGIKNFDEALKEVERLRTNTSEQFKKDMDSNFRIFGFLDQEELKSAYAMADVIVSRAGANAIFETVALGKPVILIPITYSSGNHQRINAEELAKFGAVVLEEQNLTPHILMNQIERLLKPENRQLISSKIKEFSKINSAELISEEIINYFV